MAADLKEQALRYHQLPTPGKLAIVPTKPMATQHDLALAYSPGVAIACEEIAADPKTASLYTARANLVAVVSNGTAVLGLGNLGALASKPVMEGKAVLFKKFAGIDVFDIELDETDVDAIVDTVARLEPTFGGINLEDIKAPECFIIEQRLRERMKIPVFHDDQHGTAIVAAAGMINALHLTGRDIRTTRMVVNGAGAAAIACIELLKSMGMQHDNVIMCDTKGVVYQGRTEGMNQWKSAHAARTDARTLADALRGADVFFGLSAKGAVTREMVAGMADKPIIFAMANPDPEITPEEVKEVRSDAIMATGRSDYPNQVNNVLCFPFVFRGALDVGATAINDAMKIAAVQAIAGLARAEISDVVNAAYAGEELRFGGAYILPKPFDPRLIVEVPSAVAKAAMDSGVATRPIENIRAYRDQLSQYVFRSGMVMKPVFDRAQQDPRRIAYAEGEDERVLRAAQTLVDEGLAKPILIGRREVIEQRISSMDLRLKADRDVEIVEIVRDPRYHHYADDYRRLMGRHGVTPDYAADIMRSRQTAFAAMMVRRGDADAVICGSHGRYANHLEHVMDVIGLEDGVDNPAALSVLILQKGTYFICDTYVNENPNAEQLAGFTRLACDAIRRFGMEPKVALLSHSNFGSSNSTSALKMRKALELLRRQAPDLEVDGEMHSDSALSEAIRSRIFPDSRLKGQANLLVMPTLDAANIAFNLIKVLGDGLSVGPILLGAAKPAYVVTPSITTRGLVNVSALAVVDAQVRPAAMRKAAE
jgi:malate dehydrogenase (oxaloacetate-decarboxylating)(NADP+)